MSGVYLSKVCNFLNIDTTLSLSPDSVIEPLCTIAECVGTFIGIEVYSPKARITHNQKNITTYRESFQMPMRNSRSTS